MNDIKDYLEPVDGKYIFKLGNYMHIRFNADGWVEEIGRGGSQDPLGTPLHGKPGTKLDTIYGRRYYDLYSRVMLLEIFDGSGKREQATGLLPFKDLDPQSKIYERLQKIIEIANTRFELGVAPLS